GGWGRERALGGPETEGFIERLAARPGVRVKPGDALVGVGNQERASREAVAEARVRELRARYDAERPNDTVRMQIVEEELRYSVEELARVRQRLAGLILRANTEGTFIIPQPESLPGRFVKKGDLLAYVLDLQRVTVRAVVGQANIDLVRHRRHGIEVRLAERLDDPRPATLTREVPGAREQLPSPALGSAGGGNIVTDPRDPQGVTALGKVFQLDLDVPSATGLVDVGGRVYVRRARVGAGRVDRARRPPGARRGRAPPPTRPAVGPARRRDRRLQPRAGRRHRRDAPALGLRAGRAPAPRGVPRGADHARLRPGARGGRPDHRAAALRRPDDRRRRPAGRRGRRDGDGRGQDADGDARCLGGRAGRLAGAHRDRQRLPRQARRRVDGPHLPRAGAARRAGRPRPGPRRAPDRLRLRHHLCDQQGDRLRL